MKRFLWAALLALPLVAASAQKASAWGCCGGCGGCGGFSGFCLERFLPCSGSAPGPWYLYWPTGSCGGMFGPCAAHWQYPWHFQTPAPIGESFCSDYGAGGTYPGYWYGY